LDWKETGPRVVAPKKRGFRQPIDKDKVYCGNAKTVQHHCRSCGFRRELGRGRPVASPLVALSVIVTLSEGNPRAGRHSGWSCFATYAP